MEEANKNWGGGYWRKRILTVLLPYFILETFLLPFRTGMINISGSIPLAAGVGVNGIGIEEYLLDILLIKPLYQNGWFLTYIFIWYILFYLGKKVYSFARGKKGEHIALISEYVFWVSTAILIFIFGRELWAEQALSFVAGIIISDFKETLKMKKMQKWKFVSICFFISTVFLAFKQMTYIRTAPEIIMKAIQLFIKLPYGYVIVMLPWLCGNTKIYKKNSCRLNMNFFYIVGTVSFELYLIHGYVLSVCSTTFTSAIMWCIMTGIISIIFNKIVNYLQKKREYYET